MRTQNEDFRLRVFLTLAEEGSFTRTAAVLGITQPGVSQHISELERIYGIRLFNRERGAVSLTKEGREFREYALRIEGAYMDAAVFAEESGRNSESQEHIAVEMVRSLLPILRKMNSGRHRKTADVISGGTVTESLLSPLVWYELSNP